MGRAQKHHVLLGLLLLGLAVLYGLLIKPHVVGFEYDDGLYLMASESLSQGKGPYLPYLLGEPALIKYPPLYPLLMAPLWWLAPSFPDNVVAFKTLNVLLTLLSLGMLWRYARQSESFPELPALALVLMAGFNIQVAKVATNLFSEPLYLALFMALLMCLSRSKTSLVMAITLSLALFYTRTFGGLAMAAVVLWQMLLPRSDERRWSTKQLGAYIVACILLALPWFWWVQSHTPPAVAIGGFEIRPFNSGYLADFLGNTRHANLVALYFKGWYHQLAALGNMLFPQLNGLAAFPVGLALLVALLWRIQPYVQNRVFGFAGCYVLLYLLILPFWGYYDQYVRLLLPVFPLLLLFLLMEARMSLSRKQAILPLLALALILISQGVAFAGWLQTYRGDTLLEGTFQENTDPMWTDFQSSVGTIRDFNRHAPAGFVFWSYHHAIPYALYSRGKFLDKAMVLYQGQAPADLEELQALKTRQTEAQYQWLRRNKVRFVVANARLRQGRIEGEWDEATYALVQRYPRELQLIYAAPHNMVWILELSPRKALN